jgi:hypothetical protein
MISEAAIKPLYVLPETVVVPAGDEELEAVRQQLRPLVNQLSMLLFVLYPSSTAPSYYIMD